MKACSVCKELKPLEAFNKNPKGKFGVRSNCKQCQKLVTDKWYCDNKERKLRKAKEWKEQNLHKIKTYCRAAYNRERRKIDLDFKLRCIIRERLTKMIRNKSSSSSFNLGCSIQQLRAHLESNFQPGMSWHNYGRTGWHIDHIRPLADFDLTDSRQLQQACHYTNLQPLWASDNLRTGARSVVK